MGRPVIVTVCLNVALDVTYPVAELRVGESHRVGYPVVRAGGKGTNVARTLHQLGCEVVLTGFAGGSAGAIVTDELRAHGLACRFTTIAGESRRTVTISSGDTATVFNEPGPQVSADDWEWLRTTFAGEAAGARVVVLSGSLPSGVPDNAYADLGITAAAAGAAVVVDAAGSALVAALDARPTTVTPNEAEARDALALPGAAPVDLADELVKRGAHNAVVSCGAEGLVAMVDGRPMRVHLSERVSGNPTGAGDALTAGIARGLVAGSTWRDILADAVAVAAGTVAVPYAGEVDESVVRAVRPHVVVEEI